MKLTKQAQLVELFDSDRFSAKKQRITILNKDIFQSWKGEKQRLDIDANNIALDLAVELVHLHTVRNVLPAPAPASSVHTAADLPQQVEQAAQVHLGVHTHTTF